ncbi:hypothetical protein GCM10017600_20030 [Streptosporangium carneum]|uniref:Uncharacterized protein n=1 Tax=Streptosporangium carneum TaxID=47481 RepID=A0A9W6HYV4_9ACTN|nr:hypothetical protein GCM10017600_20030 [Streptosporangium carneum]
MCAAHLLRDLEDRAGTYPGALWPRRPRTALRGLVHTAGDLWTSAGPVTA